MFRSRHILSFLLGLCLAFAATQSADAGLITGDISLTATLQTYPSSSLATADHSPEEDQQEKRFQEFEEFLTQLIGLAQNHSGASSTGHGPSGSSSVMSPAALDEIPTLSEGRLVSYLAEEDHLSLSPPFLDGIFRPPMG
ncbi:hypothetical protein [Thalassoglobus sp.]|uniref:hypothetical protein n=1 Tax=Thalassoglobus sp. TaxID=2795869 RepID=UPI003AA8A5A9